MDDEELYGGKPRHVRAGRECEICGVTFKATGWMVRTCSRACGGILQSRNHPPAEPKPRSCRVYVRVCSECERTFFGRSPKSERCSAACKRKAQSRLTSASIMRRYNSDPGFRDRVIADAQARRAEALGLGSRKIALSYLGDRDGWVCRICRKKITDRRQASMDHIIPLSKGGEHTLRNVQIAHRSCNSGKNNRSANDQLLIFG